MRWRRSSGAGRALGSRHLWIPLVLWILLLGAAAENTRNGFVLEPSAIPEAEILQGGPPRDGIPALENPRVVSAAEASWRDEELVLGVVVGAVARAYPVAVLNWHELVNDRLAGEAILVSYCPLCGTGMVFDRNVDGQLHRFGVSGLLYRSDLLMYDRETESLWSQIAAQAVTGPLLGRRLRLLRSRLESWGRWRRKFPETTVLSRATGHRRDYSRSPYSGYAQSRDLLFPVRVDPRHPPKMPTLGLRVVGRGARAYPGSQVARAGGVVEEQVFGQPVRIGYDADTGLFDADVPEGIEVIRGFWFAWAAFHPDTTVFEGSDAPLPGAR